MVSVLADVAFIYIKCYLWDRKIELMYFSSIETKILGIVTSKLLILAAQLKKSHL